MSDDCISRQAAIDAVKELCLHYTPTKSVKHPHIDFVVEELERLPSAQLERNGRWIHERVNSEYSVTGYFILRSCECSECGAICEQESNFCPNCGANMR